MAPLLDRIVCVSPVSKDLEGKLELVHSEPESCEPLQCKTLETLHHLQLAVAPHACDSRAAALLNGTLASGDLVHKFADADGTHRGVHEGTFRWTGPGLAAAGTLRGITNAGTHRAPAFEDCQQCDNPGVIEGLLVGTIRKARDRRLIGCTIQAMYRLRYDPGTDGGQGAVQGTLEGAIVCDCPSTRSCVDLTTATATGGNTLTLSGVTFDVGAGNVLQIRPMGAFTGLDVLRQTEIALPSASAVEATLVTFAQAATLEAFDGTGASLGVAKMSGAQAVAETLTLSGAGIVRATITAPVDETLLLRFCFTPS
jgi:hypothetical protein